GTPFELSGTLTTGVVSALDRKIHGDNERELEGMIQTDASINSGNSGGPLLDSQSNVIGINNAIIWPGGGGVGIGFAMPINRAKSLLDDYKMGRRPARLGVSTYFVRGDIAEDLQLPRNGGLLIYQVARGSAAEQAGLRGYQQVVRVGNQRMASAATSSL